MSEDFKINGKSFDFSQVSKNGVKKDKSIEDNKAMNLIFDKYNTTKDDKLDSKELVQMLANVKKYDSDGNKEISDKEFEALANDLNKGADENSKVKADDLKSFYSHVLELGNSDTEKVSVTDVEKEDSSGEDDNKTYTYTVQMDESFTGVIKRSLQAKGIENPTAEQIQEAKDKFKENNPDTVKTAKNGVEFLLVGAEVKLEGELENKNNSQEQIDAWAAKYGKGAAARAGSSTTAGGSADETQGSNIDKKAKEAGYRNTWGDGIYYDEKKKVHMAYNEETGEFEEIPNLKYVGNDGSKRYEIKTADGSVISTTTDSEDNETGIQARNSEGKAYLNKDYAAKKIGLRKTYNDNVYYSESKKMHYRWNEQTHTYEPLPDVKQMNKDGTYFDSQGHKKKFE